MAAIGEIRKRSGLLLVLVGGSLLLFVVGDWLTSNAGVQSQNAIGTVAGVEIDPVAYNYQLNMQSEAYRERGSQVEEKALADQVWKSMVEDKLLGDALDESGFYVSKAEYEDMLAGDNISPSLRNGFSKEGIYDVDLALQNIAALEEQSPRFWNLQKQNMVRERKFEKFYALVGKAMYPTKVEVKNHFEGQNNKLAFDFVAKKYTDISDSTVSFTEADLRAYYDAHLNDPMFEQNKSRSIKYVEYPLIPSEDDKLEAMKDAEALIEGFEKTENDSLFIVQRSANKNFVPVDYKVGDATPAIDSAIATAVPGQVFGPYLSGEFYRIVKHFGAVSGQADTTCKARHILLKTTDGDTAASIAKLKRLRKQVKAGADFAALAKINSEGPSATQGGDLGSFGPGRMVKPFQEACFNSSVGEMPIVKTQFGVHLILVEALNIARKYPMYAVDIRIEPLDETVNQIYDQADVLAAKYDDIEGFIAGANERNLQVKTAEGIAINQQEIPNLPGSVAVVDWVYSKDVKEGDISSPLELSDRIVVAALTKVREEGVQPFEDVQTELEGIVRKEKKAKMFTHQLAGMNGLTEAATAVAGTVRQVDAIRFSEFAVKGVGGSEPEVIGALFAGNAGSVTIPLKGDYAVYIAQVKEMNTVEPTPEQLITVRNDLSSQTLSNARYYPLEALKKFANVKDERGR